MAAIVGQGDALLALDNKDEARAAYEKARELAPNDAVLALKLADALSAAGKNAVLGQERSPAKSSVMPTKKNDALTAFLTAPIDLITFKRKKRPSNSGGFRSKNRWIYRPEEPGFFYQYFLFETPTTYDPSERFRSFSVVVYKFGKKIEGFYDSNETLVAIWCRLKDPDLGQADLVGRFVSKTKALFGEPFSVVGDILLYHSQGRALSVHTKNGTVGW